MTVHTPQRDAHSELTWLVGALARALMQRAEKHVGVVPALHDLAQCDFTARALRAGGERGEQSAPEALRYLPEAVLAVAGQRRELAMALAASQEHLRWREADEGVLLAEVVGAQGALHCDVARLRVMLMAPGASAGGAVCSGHLYFHLSGAAELTAPVRNPVWRETFRPGAVHELPDDMALRAAPDAPALAALF